MGNKKKKNKNKIQDKADNAGTNNKNYDTQLLNSENINYDVENPSRKRKNEPNKRADFVSDSEPKHKKPKKNKQILQSESSEKKNKKSIRQIKREKHAERQAAADVLAKDQHKLDCLNYLSQWKHDRSNWKFMKAKQVWLFKNKFSSILVPDATWPLLLEYFESAQGNIRNMLLADANKVIKQMDDWTESQHSAEKNMETEDSQDSTVEKPEDTVYKRARSLIQCLEE